MKRVVLVSFVVALSSIACGGSGESGAAPLVSRVPFAPGERLTYSLHNDAGEKIAEGILTVERAGDALELAQTYKSLGYASTDTASALVHPETLRPHLVTRVVDNGDSTQEYRATYGPDSRSVELERDEDEARMLTLPEHAYDNESSLWLWRTLPFADDYRASYRSVNAVERSRQEVGVSVTGRDRIEVPAGTFETWRLQVRNGRATRIAWINVEAPHEVVQWDNGSVVFRLEATR